ncbi:MAG: hypothetical protein H0W64_11725 [Gammaproteobacteria bacterium]|nr:hypothetical protein [Gammaproteobacteria bacterium]
MANYETTFGSEGNWRDKNWLALGKDLAHGLGMFVVGTGALIGFGFLTVALPPVGILAFVLLGLPCLSLAIHGLYQTIATPVHMVQKAWAEREHKSDEKWSANTDQNKQQSKGLQASSQRVMNSSLSKEANNQTPHLIVNTNNNIATEANSQKESVFSRWTHSVTSIFQRKSNQTKKVDVSLGVSLKK